VARFAGLRYTGAPVIPRRSSVGRRQDLVGVGYEAVDDEQKQNLVRVVRGGEGIVLEQGEEREMVGVYRSPKNLSTVVADRWVRL
jgi:hypothetical protein